MKVIKLIIIGALSLMHLTGYSQSLPIGTPGVEDYYRRAQLSGFADSSVSFTVRPVFPQVINKNIDTYYPDSNERRYNMMNATSSWIRYGKLKINLLPISIQAQFNSDHPYGWNDGVMIPAKGLQTVTSVGIFMQYGPLTIQLQPELLYAANPQFETFNKNQYNVIFARYYDVYNNIDLPVRFGTGNYTRLYPGQSSIRLNYKAMSFGISTENLWWGPGIRNSLLMSNTASGFPHLTLNTIRPVKTILGSFEGQLIGGWLANTTFAPIEPDYIYFGTNLYVPKPDNSRYLAGVVLTWQPKWVPGLFLGFNQSSQRYTKDLSSIKDYLPLFSPVKGINAINNPINKQDQLNSIFMRWLWQKEHAEIYFEFGHYNTATDLRQSLLSPDDSRAYTFGLRKLLPLNKSGNENIMIGVEVTQLQETSPERIANGESWYVSNAVRQGYTNRGEVIGAGIGPGANIQTVNVSWVKGLKKIGLQFERYLHNNDFYYHAFAESLNYSQHWVDLSVAALGEWNYKNLIFNAKIQYINSLNYQWALKKNGNDIFFENQINKPNVQIQTGITYRF
jgi:hypothetical protein